MMISKLTGAREYLGEAGAQHVYPHYGHDDDGSDDDDRADNDDDNSDDDDSDETTNPS